MTTTKWSQVRRRFDPEGRAKVDDLRAREPELAAKREAAVAAIAGAMHHGEGYIFDDVTRKPEERGPQGLMLLEALEDLGSAERAAVLGYLAELDGPGR